MKPIIQTLSYENRQLKLRIQKKLNLNQVETENTFQDLLRWLWLCGTHRNEIEINNTFKQQMPDLRMLDHFEPIDIAWHEFILMTKDYEQFCHKYLGRFIHHTPSRLNPHTLDRKNKGRIAGKRYLKHYLEFIYVELGEECFERWIYKLPKTRGIK